MKNSINGINKYNLFCFFFSDCPQLLPGTGALASSRDTAFGTIITFTCPTGQEFATGKNRITTECMHGGNWSISYIPNCQEVYCGPVPQIDNGFSIGSTNVTYRGQAMYQCYAGFAFPTGQPIERISCLADGRWEKKPTCLGMVINMQLIVIYVTNSLNKTFLHDRRQLKWKKVELHTTSFPYNRVCHFSS